MNVTGSPTYRTSVDQKIRAKTCALNLKNGSPKLREILREVKTLKIVNYIKLSNKYLLELPLANEGVSS